MDCSTLGFPVLHCLLKLAQSHVHQVNDAIQPSRPLSPPSLALNLSQHQGLFQCYIRNLKITSLVFVSDPGTNIPWILMDDCAWEIPANQSSMPCITAGFLRLCTTDILHRVLWELSCVCIVACLIASHDLLDVSSTALLPLQLW